MPQLINPKFEAVAQGLAAGKTQGDAYRDAGYKAKHPEKKVSDLLKQHPEIKGRAEELVIQEDARKRMALDMAAEKSGTSKSYVMEQLHELVERCMQHYPVLDKEGDQVYVETADGRLAPAYTFDAKGAARGLHLLGLEHGMFAQRLKIERSPFDSLPAPVLQQIYSALAQARGRVIPHEPPKQLPERSSVDRKPPA